MKSCATSLTLSPVTMLNGLASVYVPALMLSAVASTPPTLTALTVSFNEPSEA